MEQENDPTRLEDNEDTLKKKHKAPTARKKEPVGKHQAEDGDDDEKNNKDDEDEDEAMKEIRLHYDDKLWLITNPIFFSEEKDYGIRTCFGPEVQRITIGHFIHKKGGNGKVVNIGQRFQLTYEEAEKLYEILPKIMKLFKLQKEQYESESSKSKKSKKQGFPNKARKF